MLVNVHRSLRSRLTKNHRRDTATRRSWDDFNRTFIRLENARKKVYRTVIKILLWCLSYKKPRPTPGLFSFCRPFFPGKDPAATRERMKRDTEKQRTDDSNRLWLSNPADRLRAGRATSVALLPGRCTGGSIPLLHARCSRWNRYTLGVQRWIRARDSRARLIFTVPEFITR